MAGDNYFIKDQYTPYFLTCTIIRWIDVFTRKSYKDIIVESLNYCVQHKGLELYAWVIMSNHIHLVAKVKPPLGMSGFLRDFKKFTSKKIVAAIIEGPESRQDWLLDKFNFEARRTRRTENYKFWKDDNHAIDLDQYQIDMQEKIHYIHNNPVRAGLVHFLEDYVYSSAADYADKVGLVKVCVA